MRFPLAAKNVTALSAATAAAMIAQQVAGKAIRDALFLSTFYVKNLPAMMAGGALASLFAVIAVSRVFARRSPGDVLPVLFAANGVAMAGAWVTFFGEPRAAAVIVYLAQAVLGPVILSAFWSLINERFDPHGAKAAVARIASGATLGGVVGGLAAFALSRQLTLAAALAFLALLNAVCFAGALALRSMEAHASATTDSVSEEAPASKKGSSPLAVLREAPFLRTLAALSALGSASSTLLDYAFSAKATQYFGSGPSLLAFFALFGLAVSVLSFAFQVVFGKIAIERFGLMGNVAMLQILVVGGCALGLVLPGMPSLTALRGAEMVHRNTLFKSAYELFYTPIPETRKRITKAIIDVGFDRIGTVLGSAFTLLVLWRSEREEMRVLWVVVIIALVCLPVAKWLHEGYVATLAEDLRDGITPLPPSAEKAVQGYRESLIEKVELVRHPEDRDGLTKLLGERKDELARRATALLGGDRASVESALSSWEPYHAVLVPLAAPHLVDPRLRSHARAAIRAVAPDAIGTLTDILLDPKREFALRRRIAPLLAECRTQRAADGLVAALGDERLEVRYVAGRALLTMTEGEHDITISREVVVRVVSEELERVEEAADHPENEDRDDDSPQASLFDAIARVRVGRRLEHVFNVLALAMDREPLRLAFRALHHTDERQRGTALEYIQTVLPPEIRAPLWPLVAPETDLLPAPREAAEVLAELGRQLAVSETPSVRDSE